MFEVEAKIPITREQYSLLRGRLRKEASYLGFRRNRDTYYENPKSAFMRIRDRDGKYTFDLKLRKTVKGIEQNVEMEWGIGDLSAWKRVLKKLGIRPSARKTKKTELFKKDGFIIELNTVRLLGHFLEIERIVKDPAGVGEAEKELVKLFETLGFSPKQFEKRPYLELLANV